MVLAAPHLALGLNGVDVMFSEWHQSQIEKKTGTGDHYTAHASTGMDSGSQQLQAKTQAMYMS